MSVRLSVLSSTIDALDDAITTLAPAMQAITDGRVSAVQANVVYTIDDPGIAGDSLNSRRCLLIWRNADDNLASLIIPALGSTIVEGSPVNMWEIDDLSVFDGLTDALASIEAYDAQGIAINGTLVAAAIIV